MPSLYSLPSALTPKLSHSSSGSLFAGFADEPAGGTTAGGFGTTTGVFFRVPLFADRKMEEDWQAIYIADKLAWGRWVALSCAIVCAGFLAVNLFPPYDKSVFWRCLGCAGEVVAFLLLEAILLKIKDKKVASLLYDVLIVLTFLMGVWVASMTADRTAKLLDYPDKTWTLVSLQEANGALLIGALFSLITLFCKPHLQFLIIFYALAIPVSAIFPLWLGSMEYEITSGHTEYQYDKHGESVEPWAYEWTVLLRTMYLAVISVASYVSARQHEQQQRNLFATFYISQKILGTQKQQLQELEKHKKDVAESHQAIERMSHLRRGSSSSKVRSTASQKTQYPHVAMPSPFEKFREDEEVLAPSDTGALALAKKGAHAVSSMAALLGLAAKIRDQSYGLKAFFDDCAIALPELKLFAHTETDDQEGAYQQTMGALFSAYWFLRITVDGSAGFCFGVDKHWAVKQPTKSPEGLKLDADLSNEQKREAIFSNTDWSTIGGLVEKAGCGRGAGKESAQVAALLVSIALRGLMKVKALRPSVDSQRPFRGIAAGTRLEDPALALAYLLGCYPELFPSFAGLPKEQQKSVLVAQGLKDFNFSWLISAEAPPSNLIGVKQSIGSEEDLGLYLLHWFADLAGAEATPLAGAERPILYLPITMLPKLLLAVPKLLKLPSATETQVMEELLRAQIAGFHGSSSRPALSIPTDASAAAYLRLIALTASDGTKISDVFKSLSADDRSSLQGELARTGCVGQSFAGCDQSSGGPALFLPGSAGFLQAHLRDTREQLLAALRILLEVQRQARVLFPLREDLAGTRVVVDMSAFKTVDVFEVANPTAGDMWLLVQQGPTEGIVRRMRAAAVNEMTKAGGSSVHIFDFGSICGATGYSSEEEKGENATALARPMLHGKWKCIGTWGLDAFLGTVMGAGFIQRKAASKAPWPTWQFKQDADAIIFTNFTAMGELQENFLVDGPDYVTVDGWKREIQCKAMWEGKMLVLQRIGPEGKFREQRWIDDQDHLQFALCKLNPTTGEPGELSWGRSFERMG